MGIKGLLPFLKPISKNIRLSDLRGCIVAVDTYCWLHKAALCCSDKIALSQDTDLYLNYCLKYINMLLLYDIKVILVFDGKNLMAKKDVEDKRRENREISMKKALQFLVEKKLSEAKSYFDRCVNITHDMALKLIKKSLALGVKCIVAPYEADAQLAFLGRNNIVDYIVTDDSDLILFGTPKVLFKLDLTGNAVLIEKKDLNKVLGLSLERYSFDKFRYICIISGCDYFNGIDGIGLITATKMVKKTQLNQFSEFLQRINMYSTSKIILSKDDIQRAVMAEQTLQHQIVFDPINMKQVPLIDYPVGMKPSDFVFAGQSLDDDRMVFELACGKRHPKSRDIISDFDWDKRLQGDDGAFHYGTIKRRLDKPIDRRKTIDAAINRSKSMVVKCALPWRNVSRSSECAISTILDCYTSSEECPLMSTAQDTRASVHPLDAVVVSDDEADNILRMVLGKDERVVTLSSPEARDKNPFSKSSLIRSKRFYIDGTDGKENREDLLTDEINGLKKQRVVEGEAAGEAPGAILTSKKMIGKASLSHLFRKE